MRLPRSCPLQLDHYLFFSNIDKGNVIFVPFHAGAFLRENVLVPVTGNISGFLSSIILCLIRLIARIQFAHIIRDNENVGSQSR